MMKPVMMMKKQIDEGHGCDDDAGSGDNEGDDDDDEKEEERRYIDGCVFPSVLPLAVIVSYCPPLICKNDHRHSNHQ